jgi:putative membrane protein
MSVILGIVAVSAAPHEPAHAGSTLSSWDAAALVAIALAGTLYALGSWRLARRGARVRPVERAAFWSGWAAVVFAVAPPLDRAASLSLSSHMIQHELLMLIGAPLMIVGRPVFPWLWALPERARRWTGAGLSARPVGRAWSLATAPAMAWALHGFAVWIWHLPSLYQAAVRHEGIHALQHASFVGTAVLFWWGLVYGRYGRAAYGASMLYVFVTMVHTGVLGAIFALSTAPFYAVYRDRAAAAGIDATSDQQLAGLYMWIPAGAVLMTCGLALLVAWMAESERRSSIPSSPDDRSGLGVRGSEPG